MTSKANGVITLPQGGGALHGIGENFAPDLHTGTANFTVPITVPPGRNGFQPQLSLAYSSGQGNGPFGLGWSLSVPGINRKTAKGLPTYDDLADTFILSGAEDLVPISRPPDGSTLYRPRTEGLFAQIRHHRSATDNYWEVRSKDGLVSYYGTPGDAENDPATVTDPRDRTKIFAWKLTETRDPHGNRIVYDYLRDSGDATDPRGNQVYLVGIRYVDYAGPAGTDFLVSVSFSYDPANRPDPLSDHRPGFEIRTCKRYTAITTSTHADQTQPVRTYRLVYLDQPGVSLLSRIQVMGHGEDGQTELLPPLDFGYTAFTPAAQRFEVVSGPAMPVDSLSHPGYELVDLFGNALPSVLQLDGTARYWRNLGSGQFDRPRALGAMPGGLTLADPGVQVIDANGDGHADLLVTTGPVSGYFPLVDSGSAGPFHPYFQAPSFNLKDPAVRMVDLDGNGVTDALRSGTSFECFFNDPDAGWTRTTRVARGGLPTFPDVSFADPRVKWADMTGDGMQDIVLVYNGSVVYWPNLGYGRWGEQVHMTSSRGFPETYDPRRILLGDVDGDGAADLVYVDDGKVTLWLNQCGNGWSQAISIQGTPTVSDLDAVRLVDLHGTGVSGLLWSRDAGEFGRPTMFFLDFTGGVKPYLLNHMDNHMGALTELEYAPSTQFYLEDQKTGLPWETTLPFPVQVVRRVTITDSFSQNTLTTRYRYHHGYWDGGEREFRGFGMVERLDTEIFSDGAPGQTNHSPPTSTKTWFHQGPVGPEVGDWTILDLTSEYWPGDPNRLSDLVPVAALPDRLTRREQRDAARALRGSILRTELYPVDAAGNPSGSPPYTITEYLYELREESPPAEEGRARIFFPHPVAERTTQWEQGTEPQTQMTFTGDYDPHGQPRTRVQLAVPRGRDWQVAVPAGQASEPYLITVMETLRGTRDDASRYIVDRVTQARTWEIVNDGLGSVAGGNPARPELRDLLAALRTGAAQRTLIGETLNFYDGPAFTGLAPGQIGDRGALVRTETLILTTDLLEQGYRSGDAVLNPPELPPYLVPGEVSWPDEYPQSFRSALPALATTDTSRPGQEILPTGHGVVAAAGGDTLYYAATERRRYDFHDDPVSGHGLVTAHRDPLGQDDGTHDTRISYDPFALLPVSVTDPAGLETRATLDYRVLQPKVVTEPNGNLTEYTYSLLGLLMAIFVQDKDGHGDGPTPSTTFTYSLDSFMTSGDPVSVHTMRRIYHAQEPPMSSVEHDATVETREYSDGFGRLLQTRTLAEDLLFDDPTLPQPRFGSAGLPPAQSQNGPADGQQRADTAAVNVVVSGWQTYDNKGRVVEKYEPFFDRGWDYAPPAAEQWGVRATMYYDPRGRMIRTVNPDGSEQRVVYGVPGAGETADLTDVNHYTPTPWEIFSYDANDLAPLSRGPAGESLADQAPAEHHYTPASNVIDALGRIVAATARNGADPQTDWFTTHSTYDIRGNPQLVRDPLGRPAFAHDYDLANRLLRTEQLDGGLRRIVFDAAGNAIETRDGKGALTLHVYDCLRRPSSVWARDDATSQVTLRERLIYGDAGDAHQPDGERNASRKVNLLGRLARHYDEAGLLTFTAYDFKGNVLEKTRLVVSDSDLLAVFQDAAAHNWQVPAFAMNWEGGLLDDFVAQQLDSTHPHTTSFTYDALNRVRTVQYPETVEGTRPTLQPTYNRAGALERVSLDSTSYVSHIAYNAKGQRLLIAYRNGVLTRYAYDAQTFRLARLRSERYHEDTTDPNRAAYVPDGGLLQDYAYRYDLAGNIVGIVDRAPGSGVQGNPDSETSDPELTGLLHAGEALRRGFRYDPLYCLVSATGREARVIPGPRAWSDWHDPQGGYFPPTPPILSRNSAPSNTVLYREDYAYDPAGNLLSLTHTPLGNGVLPNPWTRSFGMGGMPAADWLVAWQHHLQSDTLWAAAPGNQLTHVGDDASPALPTHDYDAAGNLTREGVTRQFEWNYADRLRVFRDQADGAEPSVYALYLYDSAGQRVKKLTRRQGGAVVEATVYIDGVYEHHTKTNEVADHNTLHILDNQQRITLVRVGPAFRDDSRPVIQYSLGDHLSSSNVVVDSSGQWVNSEEYFPYGETSFGSFARKHYRFTGKERDEESGLYYYGARYYASWLARWVSCDPNRWADGLNLYQYVHNAPLINIDTTGRNSEAAAPAAPKLNDVVQYGTKVPGQKSLGTNVHKDHIIAQEKIKMMRTDDQGNVHYGPKQDPAVLVETGKATPGSSAKPHTQKTFHDVQSDMKEIRRLRQEGIKSITGDIVDPSRQAALRAGYKRESVDKAIWGQLDQLHSAQSLEETAKELALIEERSTKSGTGLKAAPGEAGFLDLSILAQAGKTGLEWAGKAAHVAGLIFTVVGAHTEAMKTYESASPGIGFNTYNKEAGYILTFVSAVAAGSIDDAIFATGVGAPFVVDAWEQKGAGPSQALVGETWRAIDAWWSK